MNKINHERRKNIFRFSIIGALSIGFICTLITGYVFQSAEGLKYITSMGAADDVLQAAFLKGAVMGGLFGFLVGSLFGALIGAAVKRTQATEFNIDDFSQLR